MPKSANQKSKLLYLADYLLEETDAGHPASVADMINYLSAKGIKAERKAIYDDLETLRVFGLDIIMTKGKTTGYFIGQRRFELPELQLLADAVRSSRFITSKKSAELIKKLRKLESVHQRRAIGGDILVANRVKTMNESIYINVDALSSAIDEGKKAEFSYFDWNAAKERVWRHDGKRYLVSPLHLSWSDGNYYLIALDGNGEIRHFRVDKMMKIKKTDIPRKEAPADFDADIYSKKVFGMYGGRTESVTLLCDKSLAGVFIDRFGNDVVFRRRKEDFEVTVKAEISPVFLSWLIGFGDKIEIISPDSVKEDLLSLIGDVMKVYGGKKS